MAGRISTDHGFGPQDLTIDAPRSSLPTPDSALPRGLNSASMSGRAPGPCMHLVEGGDPGQTCEMRDLLRGRLRWASVILLGGFSAHLIWAVVRLAIGQEPWNWLLPFHVGLTAVLAACAVSLYRKCIVSTGVLRVKESLIFGLPALYFLAIQAQSLMQCAAEDQFLPSPAVPWLVLTFTYALFIPNTVRRAALVVGALCLAPLILVSILWLSDPVCATFMVDHGRYPVDLSLAMGVAFGACVAGVYSITSLRSEAFEARQLGQYRLGDKLGSGGMGEVFKAEHQLMKRPCAIKVIRPEKAGDPKTLARFEREVRSTAKLSHWNNIDIYDYGRADDGTFYYVMEFLPGMNLQDLVRQFGPLPQERVVYLMRQTCDALAEAHGQGLIHRDIKPANIFAAQRGGQFDVAKLLDFGLAKPIAGFEHDKPDLVDMKLTQEGMITGSPLYMSPEQSLGDREPDERSDIYGLGLVMYYMLAGRPPFENSNPMRLLVAHAHEDPRPLSELQPGISDELERVVMVCLSKAPEDRYQSVAELAAALDECNLDMVWNSQRAAQWWRQQVESRREPVETAV